MIPVIPWYVTLIVIATSLAVATTVWSILSSAASRSGLAPAAQRRVRIGSALFFGAWLGAILAIGPAPASLSTRGAYFITPLIPGFFAASLATVLFALWRSESFRRALAAAPLSLLSAAQAWRVVGIVFVLLYVRGVFPPHFALPAGWGDVAVGLTAPFVGLALARGVRGARTLGIAWNAFGLLDLVVAVGMGTGLLAPILLPELGPRVPPAAAMGVLPMLLVPAFAVPFSAYLHVISLWGLTRGIRFGRALEPGVAR